MCNMPIITFFITFAEINEFKNKRVLEVGSKYINGSIRPFVERFLHPKEYIGIDIEKGKFVDKILPAEDILNHFNKNSFDVVIATEIIEHVRDWRLILNNFKKVVKEGGYVYITTRSIGFPQHGYPYDFWRFQIDDMKEIFSDFKIKALVKDKTQPGVFIKAQKPFKYKPRSMDNIKLYSVKKKRRTLFIPDHAIDNNFMNKELEKEEYFIESLKLQNKNQYSLEEMGFKKRIFNYLYKILKKWEKKIKYHLE
ncbi:MAG: methyltransferase domain-containing protein [Promethearchaeia archaeon]